MRSILFLIAAAQLAVYGAVCAKYEYKRRTEIDIDRDSRIAMEDQLAKVHLAPRRHLICPGVAATVACREGGRLSLQKTEFVDSDKRCRVEGSRGEPRDRNVDAEVCHLGNPLSILRSRCWSTAAVVDSQSQSNCTVDSNPRLYIPGRNSSMASGSPACQLPTNLALSITYFCRPKLQYLLVCAGNRQVAECSPGSRGPRLAIVYARQTSRFQFPQGDTVCQDTVKKYGRKACREANVTDAVRRRCNESASSCTLEPGPPVNGHSCALHHLLVVYACVPTQYYTSTPQDVSTGQQSSSEDSKQLEKSTAGTSSTEGISDVAQSDQGGGRRQLSAVAAAAPAANADEAEAEAGQESQLRRGKQGPSAGNEKEDIILISATATVVGVLLLATCIAFVVAVRLRGRRRHRRRLRHNQQHLQQLQVPRAGEVVCTDEDNADVEDADDTDSGLRHPALVAAASPVPPPPPPQLADEAEMSHLGGGCYLLPSPPLPPPPPPPEQQQLLVRCPSVGLASLSGSQPQVQKQQRHQQQHQILPALAATTTASPVGSVSSAEAGSGYASASSSGGAGGGVTGGGTVRFSQFSDLYFYQPNSSPSPMPPSTAPAAGGRQLAGVREEEPTVYTPRGVSYV